MAERAQHCMAVREYVDKSGETRMGVRYYISSLPAKVRLFARPCATIGHREPITLDNGREFQEDQSRARLHNAQANLGIFRRAALSLLKNTRASREVCIVGVNKPPGTTNAGNRPFGRRVRQD